MAPMEHVDVLIVGAGLSGIGAAHHLQDRLPHKTYAILEARDAIGGTWDLFRYPGIRSDSDMQTLGYRFRPWTAAEAIADGPAILDYVRDTAREAGIDAHIRYGHRVRGASWSTPDARWTVDDRGHGEPSADVRFLSCCGGYYGYDQGYLAAVRGPRALRGRARPPAVLAGGPRLRRQARGRDRQRRDRGDARARAGRDGRARDDAAALADATSSSIPREDPIAERPAPACSATARAYADHALEERRDQRRLYQLASAGPS